MSRWQRVRVVIDTNVLFKALRHRIKPQRWSASAALVKLLRLGAGGPYLLLYDERIVREWRRVLARLPLSPKRVTKFINGLVRAGKRVRVTRRLARKLRDESDRPFIEVAMSGKALIVVTYNSRDYPRDLGFLVRESEDLVSRA